MERMKNKVDHIHFFSKFPKSGNNNVKVKTVNIELPNRIFNPKPTGNIEIKGTNKINAGKDKIRFNIQNVLCVKT